MTNLPVDINLYYIFGDPFCDRHHFNTVVKLRAVERISPHFPSSLPLPPLHTGRATSETLPNSQLENYELV